MALRAYVNGTGMGRARGIPRVVRGRRRKREKGKISRCARNDMMGGDDRVKEYRGKISRCDAM